MRLDVFGREVEVVRRLDEWQVFYPGNEGKKRPALDIFVPAELLEQEILQYIADLCHEWATPQHPEVRILPPASQ